MPFFKDASECWKEILSDPKENIKLLSRIERFARDNKDTTTVVFGTSGWRGEIGLDYTFNNMMIVTEAIIAMFKEEDPAVLLALGVKDFKDIQKRGVIVGHDNRFLGPDFAMAAIGLLHRAGIAAYYSGETTTPEFSAAIEELGAAGLHTQKAK